MQVNSHDGKFARIMIVASKEQFNSCKAEYGMKLHVVGEVETRNEYTIKRTRNIVTYVKVREMHKVKHEVDRNDITLYGIVRGKPRNWVFQNGTKRVIFTLGVENDDKNIMSFITCVAWKKNARKAQNLEIGDFVGIKGELRSRSFNKKAEDGAHKRTIAYEIHITKLI